MHGGPIGRGGRHHGWFDDVTSTTVAAGTSTFTGGTGFDVVTLDSAGSTIQISAVEYLIGGSGTDVVTLGDSGNTIALRGVETLIGGSGTDVVSLAGFGTTIQVSGVETLIGGAGSDVVTITSGTVRFVAGPGGGDQVTLAAGNGADQVLFSGPHHHWYDSSTSDTQITNFQTGTDTLILSGHLRRAIDHDSDGVVDGASRATGAINMSTDDVAVLTTTVSDLHDTDFAALRTAIGSLANSSARNSVVVLANNGTDTGAYLVTDRNGDGTVAASEISLLGIFKGTTTLSYTDAVFG